MIRLFTFQPEHFNNNGDQGNIEVLRWELERANAKHELTTQIEEADFVLFGDASRAAMRHYGNELSNLWPVIESRLKLGSATLLVGSCYEHFAKDMGLSTEKVSRRSEFVAAEYFGYRNTEMELPPVTRNGLFVATSLFGPFLAKNPAYLRDLMNGWGLQIELDPVKLGWIEKIREPTGD